MSSRMTMAASVNCSIQRTRCNKSKNCNTSPALRMETLWQQDTISPPLLRRVWFPHERARSIYICAKCFRHNKPKKRWEISMSPFICVCMPMQTAPTHETEAKKVFDHFFVWRVPFTVFVRRPGPPAVSREDGPPAVMWWWRTPVLWKKKKNLVGRNCGLSPESSCRTVVPLLHQC